MNLRTVFALSLSLALAACVTAPTRPTMVDRLSEQGVSAYPGPDGVDIRLNERDFLPGQALLSLQGRATLDSISAELKRPDAAHYMVCVTNGPAGDTAASQIRRSSINQELLFSGLPPDRIISEPALLVSDTARVLDIQLP